MLRTEDASPPIGSTYDGSLFVGLCLRPTGPLCVKYRMARIATACTCFQDIEKDPCQEA